MIYVIPVQACSLRIIFRLRRYRTGSDTQISRRRQIFIPISISVQEWNRQKQFQVFLAMRKRELTANVQSRNRKQEEEKRKNPTVQAITFSLNSAGRTLVELWKKKSSLSKVVELLVELKSYSALFVLPKVKRKCSQTLNLLWFLKVLKPNFLKTGWKIRYYVI